MEAHERCALPEGWEWKKLGEIAAIGSGGTPSRGKREYWEAGTIPWVKISDISDKYISITTEKITNEGLENSSAKIFPKGTILISIFATLGDVGILKIDAACNQALAGIQMTNNNLNPDFLYYYLKTLKSHFENIGRGVAQNNINLTILKSTKISLPPLPTQRRIVSILEKAEETKRLRAQADELTDRLLQSLFLEMFGDPVKNPMGWEMIKLGELTEISSGSTPSRDVPAYFGGEIPWVKTTEVKGIRIHDTEEYITMGGLNNSSCKIYPKKSIIIAMYGQGKTRGNVGLLEIDATTNQACCVIKPNQKYDSVYLFELLRNSYDNLRNLGRGGNQPNLNGEIIKNYVIPLPPLPLQQKFARIVEKVESMRQSQNQSRQQIEDLFSTLMQKAFRGELERQYLKV